MPDNSKAPVLIVGSGPTGLTLALILRQNGIPVRIIEKRSEYPVGMRGAGLQPRTLELQHLLGLSDEVLSLAHPPESFKFYAPPPNGNKIVKEMTPFVLVPPTPTIPYPNSLALDQSTHEAILQKHLANLDCHVELSTELRSFEQFKDYVACNIVKYDENGQEIPETAEHCWLIGADGGRSVVRKGLGLTFLGDTVAIELVLGDIHITQNAPSVHWHNWRSENQMAPTAFVLRPTTQKGVWSFLIAGPIVEKLKIDLTRENTIQAFHEMTGLVDMEFGDLVWMGTWKPNIRMANKFSEQRVFIAGDAAHVHSPTGGQGMNSGVQDAFNLGWKLALVERGLASETLLTSYSAERLPVIAEMLNMTTLLLGHARAGNEEKAWERGDKYKMLGVNYRSSGIVVDERQHEDTVEAVSHYDVPVGGIIQAGDRAPDAPGLIGLSGRETRLFDIFKPTQHSILIFSRPHEAQPIIEALQPYPKEVLSVIVITAGFHNSDTTTLVDRDGYATKAYSVEKDQTTIVVVRPDGYIGAVAQTVEGMQRYFKQIFI